MKNLFLIVVFLGLTSVGMAQTKTDIQTVIQMSIDMDELQPYFHSEKPGRKPLIIEDNGVISKDIELTKFGEPVKFMKKPDLFFTDTDAFLVFNTFEINPTTASVDFHYNVEGIKMTLDFEKKDGQWIVISKELSED